MSPSADISLLDALQRVPDPRKERGVRYSIQPLLTLAAAAIISGARSVSAIGEFGRNHPEVAAQLGFKRKKLPCQGTFHYVFKALDIDKLEEAVREWALAFCAPDGSPITLHIDGKSLRGSRREAIHCVHLLSAYCDQASAIVAQMKVDGKTNEPKAALDMLRLIPMKNAIFTGDAIFTQRDLSQEIVDGGGDYFWTVKDNQKTLRAEIDSAFDAEPLPLERQARKADLRTADTIDKGHGRVDSRHIETLSRIPSLVDFPGAKQIGRITRERFEKGKTTTETVCIITSLSRRRFNAAASLKLARDHWSIENGVHRVRDVSMGEDACTVCSGDAPQVLAVLRNAAITLIRQSGLDNIAKALRSFAAHPLAALDTLARRVKDF